MRYRKNPIFVDAIQYTGKNLEEIKRQFPTCKLETVGDKKPQNLLVETWDGNMLVLVNAWIIRGTHGEYYPCANDVFESIYHEVKE